MGRIGVIKAQTLNSSFIRALILAEPSGDGMVSGAQYGIKAYNLNIILYNSSLIGII